MGLGGEAGGSRGKKMRLQRQREDQIYRDLYGILGFWIILNVAGSCEECNAGK